MLFQKQDLCIKKMSLRGCTIMVFAFKLDGINQQI